MNVTRDNWLMLAGDLWNDEYLRLYPCGDLTAVQATDALKAQYGRGFFVMTHGQAMYIIKGNSPNGAKMRYAETDEIVARVKEHEKGNYNV